MLPICKQMSCAPLAWCARPGNQHGPRSKPKRVQRISVLVVHIYPCARLHVVRPGFGVQRPRAPVRYGTFCVRAPTCWCVALYRFHIHMRVSQNYTVLWTLRCVASCVLRPPYAVGYLCFMNRVVRYTFVLRFRFRLCFGRARGCGLPQYSRLVESERSAFSDV